MWFAKCSILLQVDISVDGCVGTSGLQGGGFPGQLEFWPSWEVWNVIIQEVRAWQSLTANTYLASRTRQAADQCCSTQHPAEISILDSRKHVKLQKCGSRNTHHSHAVASTYASAPIPDNRHKQYRPSEWWTLKECPKNCFNRRSVLQFT